MSGGQRHAQAVGGQQHHRVPRAGALGQVFGVAGELNAGIVDDALLHRRGDHGRELAAHAAVDGTVEHREHMARIEDIELAGGAGHAQRHVQHPQRSGPRGPRGPGIVGLEEDVGAQELRALGEQLVAADDDQFGGKPGLRECETEIRADAGGFTRGDGYLDGCQSLYSTYASSRMRRSHSSVSSSALDSRSAVNARWRRTSSVLSNWRRPNNWMMCQPNWVRNGWLISSGCSCASCVSNSGTNVPGPAQPRSPPSAAEPGSSETTDATAVKFSPLLTMRSRIAVSFCCTVASSCSSFGLMRMCRACTWFTMTCALPRISLSFTMWKPDGVRMGLVTSPAFMPPTSSPRNVGSS